VSARFVVLALTVLMAAPAVAQSGSVQIPEPGDAALFVVAVVGLIIGRQASRRAPKRDQAPDDTQA
jgi:hypothetical protein